MSAARANLVGSLAPLLAAVRARPRHLILLAFVAGLLLAPAPAWIAPLVALTVLPLGGRPVVGGLAALAVLGGAWAGAARLEATERTALRPQLGRFVSLTATVVEAPRARKYGGAAARVEIARGPGRGEAVVAVSSRGQRWPPRAVGAEISARGRFRKLAKWEAFQRRRGAHAALDLDAIRFTGRRRGGVLGAVDVARRRAEDALTARLPRREGALARGMVLGQDEAVAESTRDDFRTAGLSHILAASGQNVVLLAALALPLLAATGLALRPRLTVLLGLIVLYVPLAGGGPSIQRAGVMGAAGVAATLAGRPASRWYALGLAAAATLLLTPAAAGEPGWQLSFAAVAAIMLLAPRATGTLHDRGVPRPLAEAIAVTLAATLGTAPLIAHHFEQVSVAALPVNVVAAPVVALVMWIGMAASAVGQIAPAAGALIAVPLGPPLGFLEALALGAADVPHAAIDLTLASPFAVAGIYAAGLVLVLMPRARAPGGAVVVVAIAAALAWPARGGAAPPPPGEVRVSFLDIGQGDGTLVRTSDATLLVDAGPPDGPILARLGTLGVDRIDLAIGTHDQADHTGGLPAVLRAHRVALLLDGAHEGHTAGHAALVRAAAARGVRRIAPAAGQVLALGRSLRVQVLSPPAEAPELHAGQDPNLRSVVTRVSAGAFDVLLTADAESEVTEPLGLPRVEALKVAHHGSEDPGLPAVLEATHPAVAAIEVGRHNTYGHPTPQALAALRAAGPPVYRTDRDGTVTLTARERDGAIVGVDTTR